MNFTNNSQFEHARSYTRRAGVQLRAPRVTIHNQFELAHACARRADLEMRAPRWLLDRRLNELRMRLADHDQPGENTSGKMGA